MPPAAEQRPRQEGEDDQEEEGAWVDGELLRQVLDGGTLVHLDVQRAVGKGENYLSVLYRARVEYHPAGSEETQVKHLIVKGLPAGEFMATFVEEIGCFRREADIYDEVLPRLYAFADERLGGKSFKRFSALSHKTSRPDTLVLDDLRPEGFVMAPRRDRLDFAHSKLVVQTLARLHVLSLSYCEEHPGYISQFDDRMYSEHNRERLQQFIPPQIKSIAEEIREWKGFAEIADKLEALIPKSIDKLIETCKHVQGGRTVLVHGDSWVNNILFKYSDSGEPIDLRFVDYQLTREASPGQDLNYFLFSSPRSDIRERHFDDLLHEYCDEFKRCAKDLRYSGPLITFDEIRKDINRTLYFGFISVLTTMAVVLVDPEDSPDLSKFTEEQVQKGEGMNIFEKVYKSKNFQEAFQNLLPFFDEQGVFE
ncbi:hypothetical protein R5R35_001952 [Gryllus longicercus]|uniref:CHK kinase-like domain-containing protein n=1 Tax=Gryllus longicercus TaxID=2509291 RepID=A0AAN9W1X3_9ORTH